MRAPFQILALPYKKEKDTLLFCVLHRSDCDQWQFVAGGGEDEETPLDAAKREIFEECGVQTDKVMPLRSIACVPTDIFPRLHTYNWPADTYVVPEYAFAFECDGDVTLSHEHTERVWLTYDEARRLLTWDSNRTALYELHCRLKFEKND